MFILHDLFQRVYSFPCSALLIAKHGCSVFFVKKPDDGRATANFPVRRHGDACLGTTNKDLV